MTKTITLSLIFTGFVFFTHAQPIENDQCENAIPILPGQIISSINNERATISELELPEPDPSTCIKTFENDLWYEFTTVEEYDYYKVIVSPLSCNTPAGLQGMIIQADDCESSQFIYRACANPYAEVSFEMVIEDSVPGNRYLIYIDGYDGTQCVFNLKLEGSQANPQSTEDIRRLQNDYGNPPPLFEPDNYRTEFLNNEATIYWSTPTSEDVDVFLVEKYIETSFTSYGRVIGTVEPMAVVAMDETPVYSFTDRRPFTDEEKCCYRIVKVNSQGKKAYSEPICLIANLAEDFYITPVEYTGADGFYYINFRNFKKQDLVFSILDRNQEVLKQMTRDKEPKRDGQIRIDMNPYEPGVYFLKVEGKSEYYLRRFIVK